MYGIAFFLFLQTLFGAPIYLIAAVLQGIWLHSRGTSVPASIGVPVLSTILSILAGAAIWSQFFMGTEMIFIGKTIHLPALIASGVLFPVVAVLLQSRLNRSHD